MWFMTLQARTQDLSEGYYNPKSKLEETMHFSDIIKLLFVNKFHTLLCMLKLFRISVVA